MRKYLTAFLFFIFGLVRSAPVLSGVHSVYTSLTEATTALFADESIKSLDVLGGTEVCRFILGVCLPLGCVLSELTCGAAGAHDVIAL